jgi:hypothetical protein
MYPQVEIEVHENLVGAVIGPAGKSIAEMQHYSGTLSLPGLVYMYEFISVAECGSMKFWSGPGSGFGSADPCL